MTNVIDIDKWRQPEDEYAFTMSAYRKENGRWSGKMDNYADTGKSTANMIREFADALEEIAFSMRIRAEEMEPSKRGQVLAEAHVYRDSTVIVRLDEGEFETEEQRDWLYRRFDDAKRASFDGKDE